MLDSSKRKAAGKEDWHEVRAIFRWKDLEALEDLEIFQEAELPIIPISFDVLSDIMDGLESFEDIGGYDAFTEEEIEQMKEEERIFVESFSKLPTDPNAPYPYGLEITTFIQGEVDTRKILEVIKGDPKVAKAIEGANDMELHVD